MKNSVFRYVTPFSADVSEEFNIQTVVFFKRSIISAKQHGNTRTLHSVYLFIHPSIRHLIRTFRILNALSVCVCVYVCMYVVRMCVGVYMYVFIELCMYVCMYPCLRHSHYAHVYPSYRCTSSVHTHFVCTEATTSVASCFLDGVLKLNEKSLLANGWSCLPLVTFL